MPVLLRPAITIPRIGDRCYAWGASSTEDSISSVGASRETLAARARRAAFNWSGLEDGCLPRMRATIPVICGAANLLPVDVTQAPSCQATRTLIPRAPNWAGARGLQ